MSGSNGELEGAASLWRDEAEPVPLLGSSAAEELSARPPSNGDQRQVATITERPSSDEFSAERMLRAAAAVPPRGWRRGLYRLSGGLLRIGPSAAEVRHRELVASVKAPVHGCRKVAFISRKGGVGKTTTCLMAGTPSPRSAATA